MMGADYMMAGMNAPGGPNMGGMGGGMGAGIGGGSMRGGGYMDMLTGGPGRTGFHLNTIEEEKHETQNSAYFKRDGMESEDSRISG